jgi:hypothetical protein
MNNPEITKAVWSGILSQPEKTKEIRKRYVHTKKSHKNVVVDLYSNSNVIMCISGDHIIPDVLWDVTPM